MLDELAAPSKVKPCLRDIGADRIVMNYMESRYYTIAPGQLAAVDSQHLAALVFEKARAMVLGIKFNDKNMPRKFTEVARPGFYLRVIETGVVEAGDPVEKVQAGEGGLSVRDLFRAYSRPRSREACDILERALTLPDLDPDLIPRIKQRLRAFTERTE